MELSLGADFARLLDPEDLTSFAVVIEGDEDPGPEALAAGGVLGLGDHAWVRTDALRRLAEAQDLRAAVGFGPSTRALLIATEGPTDPDAYAEVIRGSR